jgi:hypothetical protein
MPKKTVNIILKAGGHPTGFTPKGEFHRDSVNGHAWTNNLAVRAALLRSEILSYPDERGTFVRRKGDVRSERAQDLLIRT